MHSKLSQIARKEVAAFFSSPIAFIFLFAFLLTNLFIFFWVEAFFARNIADIRPFFNWMPILLVFLVAALTMRMWAEERRMGTIEILLTLPISTLELVIGKFVGCMLLVLIALALTIPVPITVSLMGNLDWGPVVGGYIATIFLAGAYTSIGLFISSRSDNQIVSLIITSLIGLALYLVGSDALTALVSVSWAEFLKSIGSGARFSSIARGVIDVRDLYYYLSIVGVFVSLNVLSLESLKWSAGHQKTHHRQWRLITTFLVLNFIVTNFWLSHINTLRLDVTKGQIYSLSQASRTMMQGLQEPLLIRGYFSAQTHPLLAPLVPQIRDLLEEYSIVGEGHVRAEFIDPRDNPDLEEEANRKYGIKPVPFQVADKYQAGLVNSYFNILIQYGDKYETLGFRELIEIKMRSETDLEVRLRNPEYDITRSIKKVVYGFQNVENLFAGMQSPVTFNGYISSDNKLPPALVKFKEELTAALTDLKAVSNDKLIVEFIDPEAQGGEVAKKIMEDYGFRPMVASLLDTNSFYFYLTLQEGDKVVQLPLPESLDKEGARKSIEAGLKRFSTGFLRTVGIKAPTATPSMPWAPQQDGSRYELIRQKLSEGYQMKNVDLTNGNVPEDVDLLLVVAPKDFEQKQLFAVDQFLMKGGTVVLATSPFSVARTQTNLNVSRVRSGLEEWLKSHGIKQQDRLVLDTQNEPYPVPVRRNLGGFIVEEIRKVNYPFFVDVRSAGLNEDNLITSGLPQVTINWASPLEIDSKANSKRNITTLLTSSEQSWTSDSTNIEPNFEMYPQNGFPSSSATQPYKLAAVVEGSFDSFFKDKSSPLLEADDTKEEKKEEGKEEKAQPLISGIIDRSPDSARIIVFSSNEFLNDETLKISASSGENRFLNSLQIVENAVDWSLEDRSLLSIRSRGQFSRTLQPMEQSSQLFWEYLNYALALLGLAIVYFVYRSKKKVAQARYHAVLD